MVCITILAKILVDSEYSLRRTREKGGSMIAGTIAYAHSVDVDGARIYDHAMSVHGSSRRRHGVRDLTHLRFDMISQRCRDPRNRFDLADALASSSPPPKHITFHAGLQIVTVILSLFFNRA